MRTEGVQEGQSRRSSSGKDVLDKSDFPMSTIIPPSYKTQFHIQRLYELKKHMHKHRVIVVCFLAQGEQILQGGNTLCSKLYFVLTGQRANADCFISLHSALDRLKSSECLSNSLLLRVYAVRTVENS